MNQSQEISKTSLVTICKDCCFAEYKNHVQTGCHARVMKDDQYYCAYDNGTEYRVFQRQCQFFRNATWSDKNIAQKLSDVYKETELKYNIFINCDGNINHFKKTLDSVKNQSLLAQKIIGVEYNGQGEDSFNAMKDSDLETSWTLEEFLEDVVDWRDNMVLKYKKGAQLFVFIDAGNTLHKEYFENLSVKVNHEDLRFSCITGDILAITYGAYFLQYKEDPLRKIIEKIGDSSLKYEDTIN